MALSTAAKAFTSGSSSLTALPSRHSQRHSIYGRPVSPTVVKSIPSAHAGRGGTSCALSEQSPSTPLKRRDAILALSLTAAAPLLAQPRIAFAADDNLTAVTRKVFFDIEVEQEPLGRVVVGVYGNASNIAAQRFVDLAVGSMGVGYRRTQFGRITEEFIENKGVRTFSYGGETPTIAGGDGARLVREELLDPARPRVPHDSGGLVTLQVGARDTRVVESKLVAQKGKLITVEEKKGPPPPNGSGFLITLKATPELDEDCIVVGRILEGEDVINAITTLPVVKDNTDSTFFQVAKTAGDSRAAVAEASFNRPFKTVRISRSGVLDE
eukprot:jgi/Mesvir1/22453/Mv17920-RA.1